MPVVKYAALPTARMEAYSVATQYDDLAVLDFSTKGHGVFNFGNLARLVPFPTAKNAYTAHITEVDLALGNIDKLKSAVKNLADNGFKNIFLMQSSLASVLGFDISAYAEECSSEFGVNVFTSTVRLHDDCFKGAQEILFTLSSFADAVESDKSGFNLLGGRYTLENRQNHRYIAELIENNLGLELRFDSLNTRSLSEWKKAAGAEINVVTSKSALKTAMSLNSRFATPYIYFCPLGKDNEDKGLRDIASLSHKEFCPSDDKVFEFAVCQTRNVLCHTNPKIVCYTDADKLSGLRSFFEELSFPSQYYCNHSDSEFDCIEINNFIERFSDTDCLVISCDRVCKYMKKSVVIEKLGLDYKLLTPLRHPTCGKDGAYELMEKLVEQCFE